MLFYLIFIVKQNTINFESIVGNNLISEPVVEKDLDDGFGIDSSVLVRSTPAKYKLEIEVETTGSESIMQIGYNDPDLKWCELVQQ